MKPFQKTAFLIATALLVNGEIQAQTVTNYTGTTTGLINTGTNWDNGLSANDINTWNGQNSGTGPLALTLNANFGTRNIDSGTSFNFTANQTEAVVLTNSAVGTVNLSWLSSTTRQAFNMEAGAGPVTLGGSGTAFGIFSGPASVGLKTTLLRNNSSSLATFGSNVSWNTGGGASQNIAFSGNGTGGFDIAGPFSNNQIQGPEAYNVRVGVVMTGGGAVTLRGDNISMNGTLEVQAGTVAIGSANATGVGAINLNGTTSRLRSADATDRTITNPITISQSSNFGSAGTGNLTFTGAVNAGSGAKTWTVDGVTATFSNAISGSNLQYKQGNGTLHWSGDSSATLTGAVQIDNGTLRISNNGSLGNTAGVTNISGGASTSVLEILNNISLAENIVMSSKSSAENTTIRNVSGNNTLTGTLTLFGGGTQFNIESAAGLLTINSNLVTPNTELRFLNISGAGNVALLGSIQDNSPGTIGLTKSGNGTLALTGTNTYSGNTTLNGGLLTSVNNVAVASGSTLKFNGGSISVNGGAGYILNSGTMDVNGQTIAAGSYEASPFWAPNAKLLNSSATAAVIDGTGNKNTVWINATGAIIETVGNLTISSIVNGANGFTKTGNGTLFLTHPGNSYDGDTIINAGTLSLSYPSLSDNDTVTIDGGTLNLNFEGEDQVDKAFALLGGFFLSELPAGLYNSSDGVGITGPGYLRVGAPVESGYASWASAFSSPALSDTAATSDPDFDGLTNAMEYALGLDPRFSSGSPGVTSNGGKTITFTKGAEAKVDENVTYDIETSISLGVAPTPWVVNVTDVTEDADTISITFPTLGPAKDFARLKVTLAP
jgi:fibronectin-binding autotransporter adhesin